MLGSSGCEGAIARLENLLMSAAAMGNAQVEKNSDSSNMGKLIKVCASGIRHGQEGLLITGPSSDIDSLSKHEQYGSHDNLQAALPHPDKSQGS